MCSEISTTPAEAIRIERRNEPRHRLREKTSASFYNNCELYNAALVDLSAGGARFILNTRIQGKIPDLSKGRTMECYIGTWNGRSKCRGTVQWTHRSDGRLTWGISFIELSNDTNDPLQATIAQTGGGNRGLPTTGMALD